MNYSERDLLTELAVANGIIQEAEEAFDKLRKDYYSLREHTDRLEESKRQINALCAFIFNRLKPNTKKIAEVSQPQRFFF